jgi:hypothetical protein
LGNGETAQEHPMTETEKMHRGWMFTALAQLDGQREYLTAAELGEHMNITAEEAETALQGLAQSGMASKIIMQDMEVWERR